MTANQQAATAAAPRGLQRASRSAKYWLPIFVSPKRLFTVAIAKLRMAPLKSNPRAKEFGNYSFEPQDLNEHSVIYSFGIGRNISFDRAIADAVGCKVYLFDPSRNAIKFATDQDPNGSFECIHSAVWLWDGENEIAGEIREGEVEDASFTNQRDVTTTVKIPCRTIASFMQEFGHEKIDILKMDIEGAALIVLEHLLTSTDIRPRQIGVELERPSSFGASLAYWSRLKKLINLLEREGYVNYCKTFKGGYAIEMLCVRK